MCTAGFPWQEGPFEPWGAPGHFQSVWSVPFGDFADCVDVEEYAEVNQVAEEIRDLNDSLDSIFPGVNLRSRLLQCLKKTAYIEHLHIAYLLSILGCKLNGLDHQAEAEIVHRRALCIGTKVLGTDHPDLANSMEWLAFSLYRQGKHKEAILLCYSTTVLVHNSVGPYHPDMANCYFNLATVLEAMGLFEHACVLRRKGHTVLGDFFGYSVAPGPVGNEYWMDRNCVLDSPTYASQKPYMTDYYSTMFYNVPVQGLSPWHNFEGFAGNVGGNCGGGGGGVMDPVRGVYCRSEGSDESCTTMEPHIRD